MDEGTKQRIRQLALTAFEGDEGPLFDALEALLELARIEGRREQREDIARDVRERGPIKPAADLAYAQGRQDAAAEADHLRQQLEHAGEMMDKANQLQRAQAWDAYAAAGVGGLCASDRTFARLQDASAGVRDMIARGAADMAARIADRLLVQRDGRTAKPKGDSNG